MKNFIKQKLYEELIKRLPDTTFSQELKYASSPSINGKKADLNKIRFRLAKAAQMANQFITTNPDNNYFQLANDGDGFYQVEFRHDGQIKTKQIKSSSDMEQNNGRFQPTDVGTCRDFQNIARYCFVKAGKNGGSIGISPAEDAANKALIIFKDEIFSFLGDTTMSSDKAAQISKEKMSDKQAKHKEKKDLETQLGRRLSDTEWFSYLKTGDVPTKNTLSADKDSLDDFERKQAEMKARRDKALTRMNK